MKIFVYLILFIALLPVVYAPFEAAYANLNAGGCSGARFCGVEELECDYTGSDDICPQDYGNWDSCRYNNYGKKCWPCDPNCGSCGQGVSIYAPNSIRDTPIDIELSAYNGNNYQVSQEGFVETYYSFKVYENGNNYLVNDDQCINNRCSGVSRLNSPDISCKTTRYGAEILRVIHDSETGSTSYTLIDNSYVFMDAKTAPDISINELDENNDFRVAAACNGDQGADVRMVQFLIEKRIGENYQKVNPQGQECNTENCNRLAIRNQRQGNYFTFNFNDANFNNGEYRITAKAYSWILDFEGDIEQTYPENQDSEEFIIDKGLAGETGGAYQGSKVLNIILARIKTWI